ncbi:MAG: glycosyltransferase [Chloroflexota bacterium]|nr:glycosyltransferase [Chloroflexota bacterium]
MRICAVTPYPPPASGVGDYGELMAAELTRHPRVDSITVLADRGAGLGGQGAARIVDVRRAWSRDALIPTELVRQIERLRPDVVWFNFGLTMFGTRPLSVLSGLSLPLLVKLLGYPVVVTLHEMPALADLASLAIPRLRGRVAGWAAMRLLLCADEVIVTLDRYRRHLGARHRAGNVTHIPHGLWRRPEPLAEADGASVLVFGTFGPHKDPRLVLDAVRRIRRRARRVRLLVAGTDHPRFPGFMARLAPQLEGDDEWAGYVPAGALPALFGRATLVVVPSTASTGSSGVIHRAVGHARPVVVSDLPDFRALAAEEGLALAWASPGDAAALAAAIDELLEDRALRDRLVAHNMRAAARLSPERTAESYLRVFAGVRSRSTAALPSAASIPTRVEA